MGRRKSSCKLSLAPSGSIRARWPHQPERFAGAQARQNLDRLLDFNEKAVLTHAGSVLREAMDRIARERFDAFDENRRIAEARQADAEEIAELERIEKQLEHKKGSNELQALPRI